MSTDSRSKPLDSFVDPRGLSLGWVHAFVCVAKLGSFKRAASFMGVTQPTVSRQVGDLEKVLGTKLLSRTIPPKMTEDGERFASIAQEFLFLFCNFRTHIVGTISSDYSTLQSRENNRLTRILSRDFGSAENVEGFYNFNADSNSRWDRMMEKAKTSGDWIISLE